MRVLSFLAKSGFLFATVMCSSCGLVYGAPAQAQLVGSQDAPCRNIVYRPDVVYTVEPGEAIAECIGPPHVLVDARPASVRAADKPQMVVAFKIVYAGRPIDSCVEFDEVSSGQVWTSKCILVLPGNYEFAGLNIRIVKVSGKRVTLVLDD